jgi:hypothetical protein
LYSLFKPGTNHLKGKTLQYLVAHRNSAAGSLKASNGFLVIHEMPERFRIFP